MIVTGICTVLAFIAGAALLAGLGLCVSVFFYLFLVMPFVILIQENIKADSFETWLEDQVSTVTEQDLGKFTVTKVTYQIPAGVAILKLIKLANKKKLTESELAFTNELIETINSIETLGYSVESIK